MDRCHLVSDVVHVHTNAHAPSLPCAQLGKHTLATPNLGNTRCGSLLRQLAHHRQMWTTTSVPPVVATSTCRGANNARACSAYTRTNNLSTNCRCTSPLATRRWSPPCLGKDMKVAEKTGQGADRRRRLGQCPMHTLAQPCGRKVACSPAGVAGAPTNSCICAFSQLHLACGPIHPDGVLRRTAIRSETPEPSRKT